MKCLIAILLGMLQIAFVVTWAWDGPSSSQIMVVAVFFVVLWTVPVIARTALLTRSRFGLRAFLVAQGAVCLISWSVALWCREYNPDLYLRSRVTALGGVCRLEYVSCSSPRPPFFVMRKRIVYISLANTAASDIDVSSIGSAKYIRALSIGPTGVSMESIERLRQLEHLTTLSIEGSKTDDNVARGIARIRGLRHVFLYNSSITDASLEHFTKLRRLVLLDLTGSRLLHGTTLESLSSLPSLAILRLGATSIDETGTAAIARLEGLRILDLKGCSVGDVDVGGLSKLPRLEKLDLRCTNVSVFYGKAVQGILRGRNPGASVLVGR